MGRKKSSMDSSEIKRYHITVPLVDKQVIDWVNAQDNISHSMRILIKAFVERYGYVDPLCLPTSDFRNIFGSGRDYSISEAPNAPENQTKTGTAAQEIRETAEIFEPETAKNENVPQGKPENPEKSEKTDTESRSVRMLDSLMGL